MQLAAPVNSTHNNGNNNNDDDDDAAKQTAAATECLAGEGETARKWCG
jgi:hypothetical protein